MSQPNLLTTTMHTTLNEGGQGERRKEWRNTSVSEKDGISPTAFPNNIFF